MAIERRAPATWAAPPATCLSMALANGLAEQGHAPTLLETEAVCAPEQADAGFRITALHLSVRAQVDGLDEATFHAGAEEAREGCPVSNALADSVEITPDASP